MVELGDGPRSGCAAARRASGTLPPRGTTDALGRRVEKAVSGGATTRYVLDGPQVVEEYDGQDVWQARYVYEDGIDRPRVMDRADQADVNGNQNTTEVLRFTYHQQALGSVTEVSEPGGSVVEWVTYDVYGNPAIRDQQGNVVSQSPVGNPYLFTGREFDAEDGLYFYRARMYDTSAGRFLQRDPLGCVEALNLYTYAATDPALLTDPSGLFTIKPDPSLSPRDAPERDKLQGAMELAGKTAEAIVRWLLENQGGLFKRFGCKWDNTEVQKLLKEFFEKSKNGAPPGPEVLLGGVLGGGGPLGHPAGGYDKKKAHQEVVWVAASDAG